MRRLTDLLKNIYGARVQGDLTVQIEGLAYDSRKVQPGFAFICIEGYKTDGHLFAQNAVENGATVIIAKKPITVPSSVTVVTVEDTREALAYMGAAFYDYPGDKLNIIGVTGTNGKTTTTHLIENILVKAGKKVGLIGTIKNKIIDRVLPVTNTTPESLDLQALLAEMVDAGVDYAVMEVSSHALELNRVAGCEYDQAIFTNITQDHLDFHETMDNYLAAKQKLFINLGKNSRKSRNKYGIINIDDSKGQSFLEVTHGQVITYGIQSAADVRAEKIDLRSDGVIFTAVTPRGSVDLKLNLTGLFNVYNSLAAVASGLGENIALPVIKEALEEVKGVPGRMEKVEAGQPFAVLVDYAHTPDGLENVLSAAREFTKGRLITVFGCGGDRDRTKRPIMGEVSAKLSDFTVLTSDNPRSESPAEILRDIEEGVKPIIGPENYTVIEDRKEAIRHALNMAKTGDVVVIAGKGHETYQIIGTKVLPFDDREVAIEILKEKFS
ncbi:UDP-N-acetylmuramyl tripeptide synthetase [Thermincola ferriacetica]|uniref:UDP-N-acetylmuramoyl-L-alanyl-D-glutamate--2,6-diaminopimelate ligase n=1 Tax=Thermincola ferriacetica TaxID=281456 RepID=A0A0L6W4T9_9FIRM|nr:UDP-N-acetylmuramoyl-L-alanyl-D-glutamate--2,6-diaminopimelate ligase [Thermincola ferriacetica]KNZ70476.1 UDP-N-acetylmuramyl tripeptide synthetase [Thermincola ferriacetica]